MPFECRELLACSRVPDSDKPVVAGRRHSSAVGTEGNRSDIATVPTSRISSSARPDPTALPPAFARRRQTLAIRTDCDAART